MQRSLSIFPLLGAIIWLNQSTPVCGQEIAPVAEPVAQETSTEPPTAAEPKTKDGKQADKANKNKADAGASLASEITRSCKEREKRMIAINEAMLKLREAGDDEEANRLEARLQAMVQTRDPREDDALVANKAELLLMKRSVLELTAEIMNLRAVLEQNSRIIDEILKKAVPDISPSVIEEMKNQAKKQEIRKVP
jgi:hypothetical protein